MREQGHGAWRASSSHPPPSKPGRPHFTERTPLYRRPRRAGAGAKPYDEDQPPVLLSESELRSALEPLLDRLLVERLRLFQLQLEPRLQAMIEAAVGPAARAQAETGARLAAIVGA